MRLTTTLLNGESLTLATTTSRVSALGPPVGCSVLLVDGVELELHSGDGAAADFFFTTTGSSAASTVRLRGGQELVTGAFGGRPTQGLAFRVDVDGASLYGAAPPTLGREALAGALADATPGTGRRGLRLQPSGRVAWSPQRSHDVAVSVADDSGRTVLLDVRRTVQGPAPGDRGRRVRGGWLSRSDPTERIHVVLETDAAVAYGLPPTEQDLELTVDVLSDLEITVEADA